MIELRKPRERPERAADSVIKQEAHSHHQDGVVSDRVGRNAASDEVTYPAHRSGVVEQESIVTGARTRVCGGFD
jgi:hypothetical protein